MWGAIKKALNSTLGTYKFQPLDELSKKNAYRRFYEKMRALKVADPSWDRGDKPGLATFLVVVEETDSDVVDLINGFDSYTTCAVILPPNIKRVTNKNVASRVYFYPEGFERLETYIEENQYINERLFEFPSTTQFIQENAFARLKRDDRVIIHRKQGEIEGHPWGAAYDNITYLDR